MYYQNEVSVFQDRKEYRKSFTSPGLLHVAGETVAIVSHDVSVKGVLLELLAGKLLSGIRDIQEIIKQALPAEIFVRDLMLTGEAQIVWTRAHEGKLMIGVEFVDVRYNAKKLWRKRQYYRKQQALPGLLINNADRTDMATVNISTDGLMMRLKEPSAFYQPGNVIKLTVANLGIKAIAKILWTETDASNRATAIGARYLSVE